MSVPSPSLTSELTQDDLLQPANVADMLLLAAQCHPYCGVYLASTEPGDEASFVAYPTLLNDARRVLGGLRACGRPPGANVILLLDGPGDFTPIFWACILGGYIPCPLAPIRNDPQRWSRHLAHVTNLLDHPLVVATGALRMELPSNIASIDLKTLGVGKPEKTVHYAEPDEPAVLMLTSGSTGNSKAVVLTHGNLLASMAGRAKRQRLTSSDTMLNWIAFDHVAALLESHMIAVYVGATQVHAEAASILSDPMRFLRLIDRHRVSVAFAPNFLLGQINVAIQSARSGAPDESPLELDLSSLRRIVTGGEANVVETGRRFLDLLATYGLARNVLWPAFGMTETCAASVYSDEFPYCDADQEFACVGRPIKGLEMRVVGENGLPSPTGEAGELQLRGPVIFNRYYNNVTATHAAFTDDGWFQTGDLGCIDDGRLRLVGRRKDCIIVSGVNYFSHELETALERIDGIQRSFIAAFPTRPRGADTEQLVVAFAPSFSMDNEPGLYRAVTAIRNTSILLWGFTPAMIIPLPSSDFPKTSLGKIQRPLMRKRLEAGEFAAYETRIGDITRGQLGRYTPPEGPIETAIIGIYADMFKLDPATISTTTSFFDFGGTSLDIIKLKQKLGEHLGMGDIPIAWILQNPTVRALARKDQREYDPVVTLQSTGNKTPLFCVHPATGEVLVFVSLANYFVNERPFFALRARGFNEGESPFESIDEMVNIYVEAIQKKQSRGPYAIAGYSFGGPIAFEVAKALEARGERVAFCGSIDGTVFIGDREYKLNEIESAFRVAYFLGLVDMEQMLKLPAELSALVPMPDPYQRIMELASPKRLAELDLNIARFRAWAELSFALVTMGQEYIPSGAVESATVFYAEPLWGTKRDWLEKDLVEWKLHTRTTPRYVEVDGTHSSLLEREHVASFQVVLRAELNRSLNGN